MPKWRKLLFGPNGCCSSTSGSIEDFTNISYKNFQDLNISRDSTLEYNFDQRCFLQFDEIETEEKLNLEPGHVDCGENHEATYVSDHHIHKPSNKATCYADDCSWETGELYKIRRKVKKSWSLSNVLDLGDDEAGRDKSITMDAMDDKRCTYPPSRKKGNPSPFAGKRL